MITWLIKKTYFHRNDDKESESSKSNESDTLEGGCATVKHMPLVSRCSSEPSADYLARYIENDNQVAYSKSYTK